MYNIFIGIILIMIDYEDILSNYNDFIKHISYTNSLNNYLISNINQFLAGYYKNENYNETFTDNLELVLANIESYYMLTDDAIELLENINLPILKSPQAEIINFYDFIKIPEDYDTDMYVDMKDLPDLSELWEKPKPKLKLYQNDKFDADK